MKKENIYIDLSKLSEEQRKHIFSLLPEPYPEFDNQHDINEEHFKLHISGNSWWVLNNYEVKDKTELTYPEFIKLFEGGESKEDFAIYKRTFNNIPYPRVEWECNCGFKHCINEGFEQDYRKDNFKEIRLPTGRCLKCKKEIKTHPLESKEVLQVENNNVFFLDECIFTYCPTPNECKNGGCLSKSNN